MCISRRLPNNRDFDYLRDLEKKGDSNWKNCRAVDYAGNVDREDCTTYCKKGRLIRASMLLVFGAGIQKLRIDYLIQQPAFEKWFDGKKWSGVVASHKARSLWWSKEDETTMRLSVNSWLVADALINMRSKWVLCAPRNSTPDGAQLVCYGGLASLSLP